jgi:hypothetical protein
MRRALVPKPPGNAPRSWHEWYAKTFGYFWLPCPLCGEEFGGHEWMTESDLIASIPDPESGPGAAVGICPTCTEAGKGVATTTVVGELGHEAGG